MGWSIKGRRQKKKEKREKNKEKREKKGKLKEGNHRACAKAGPEHATVTTVRLGAYFIDYGALGSIIVTTLRLGALHFLRVTVNNFGSTFWVKSPGKIIPLLYYTRSVYSLLYQYSFQASVTFVSQQ